MAHRASHRSSNKPAGRATPSGKAVGPRRPSGPGAGSRADELLQKAIANSPFLETWLKANKLVRERLLAAGRDRWPLLETIVSEAKLTDWRGGSPSLQTLRRTWARVERSPAEETDGLPARPTLVRVPETPFEQKTMPRAAPPSAATEAASARPAAPTTPTEDRGADPWDRAIAARKACDAERVQPRLPRRGS